MCDCDESVKGKIVALITDIRKMKTQYISVGSLF